MTTSKEKYLPDEIPEYKQVQLTIYYKVAGYESGRIGVYAFDWAGDKDTIILCKPIIQVKIDKPVDFRKHAIKSMQEAIAAIQAKAYMDTQELQQAIDKLLRLEHKTEVQEILNPEWEDSISGLEPCSDIAEDDIPF